MKIAGITKTTFFLAVLVLFIITAGCILDPKEAIDENPVPEEDWPDRTDKGDCIEIIDLVYKHRNIEKYKEVLLKPDQTREKFKDGYLWLNQELEVDSLGEDYSYDQDCLGTQWILDNAETLRMDLYPSVIVSETWTKIDEIFGDPCDDCWSTQKNYVFSVDIGEDTFNGDDEVRFVIGPDPDNPGKYVIYRADDLLKQ